MANRINNTSIHTRQIYDLHCLCNILVVKIPKIKVRNPSPFRKTYFVTSSLMKQYHVLLKSRFTCFFFVVVVFFCRATFLVHFSRSLMEANRSKQHLTKCAYLIRLSCLKWLCLRQQEMTENSFSAYKYTLYTRSTNLRAIVQFWNSIVAKIRFRFLKDSKQHYVAPLQQ